MSYSKLKVYYQGDGINSYNSGTTSQLEKKITITLPVQAKKYGDEYGYDKIVITSYSDHLVLQGSNGQTLFDRDINGDNNNEAITKITRYEWIGEGYVEPKPLNKYSKIKVYHNWQGDGRTLTLPLSKECIEYGDRYGYDNIKVSQTGWEFAMVNKEGGTMVYKSFQDYDVYSGVGEVIKIEWLNAQIESEIKKLKNQFTKVRVNHGANSKMTVALPKKLTEFGDRFGYDKITFARKGSTFYLYDPDGFILLRKDCWETGLGEIKSMEWLNDKSEAVPFEPAPAPFEAPVEEPIATPAPTPVSESTPEPASTPVVEATPIKEEEPAPTPVVEPVKKEELELESDDEEDVDADVEEDEEFDDDDEWVDCENVDFEGVGYSACEGKACANYFEESDVPHIIIPEVIKDEDGNEYVVDEFDVSDIDGAAHITLPKTLERVYGSSFSRDDKGQLTVDFASKASVDFEDGVFYKNNKKELTNTKLADTSDTFVVLEGVEVIDNDAFEDYEDLKVLYLPSTIKTINPAFSGCINLEKVVIAANKDDVEFINLDRDGEEVEIFAPSVKVIFGQPALDSEPVEVSTSTVLYDVVLKSAGKNKLEVIKLVREECGLGLKEAKDLIDNVSGVVASLARDEAITLKDDLEQLGAKVELLNEKKVSVYVSSVAPEPIEEVTPVPTVDNTKEKIAPSEDFEQPKVKSESQPHKQALPRFYRTSKDKVLAGVCAGIARGLNINVAIVRLAVCLITLFTFALGFWAYVILSFLMPKCDE